MIAPVSDYPKTFSNSNSSPALNYKDGHIPMTSNGVNKNGNVDGAKIADLKEEAENENDGEGPRSRCPWFGKYFLSIVDFE